MSRTVPPVYNDWLQANGLQSLPYDEDDLEGMGWLIENHNSAAVASGRHSEPQA